VDPYVNAHKVASAEATHIRMLERLREIGKPVILSTAAKGNTDIDRVVMTLGDTPTVLLYCVGAYPARCVDLYQIHNLRVQFRRLAGYSDHSIDVETIPPLASSHGAVVIEKHVNFVGASGPDAPHSLNTDEFKRMVFAIQNQKYKAYVTPDDVYSEFEGISSEDMGFVKRHNRRLIATRDIPEGAPVIEGENFGIYRSLVDDTRAASPWLIDRINGKSARRAIMAGEGIAPDDVA
jgi:sialic acid synthase SpsE